MLIRFAEFVVMVIEMYALAGVVFGVLFIPRAAARMDPGLTHAPIAVRLLILPGVIALWPLLAVRWAKGASAPIERNPHRDRASTR